MAGMSCFVLRVCVCVCLCMSSCVGVVCGLLCDVVKYRFCSCFVGVCVCVGCCSCFVWFVCGVLCDVACVVASRVCVIVCSV